MWNFINTLYLRCPVIKGTYHLSDLDKMLGYPCIEWQLGMLLFSMGIFLQLYQRLP